MTRSIRTAACLLAIALIGAVLGLVLAIRTPAHIDIAGSDTRLWLQLGRTYDQLGVNGLIAARRPTTRRLLGEAVGVRAEITVDVSQLVDDQGRLNTDILPAYVQAYSDPEQLISDARRSMIVHLAWFAGAGAAFALAAVGAVRGYRAWRASYDGAHFPQLSIRAAARSYHQPERLVARRAAAGLVVVLLLGTVPSGVRHAPAPTILHSDPALAGTPLAGIEFDGLLRPTVVAARSYIERYFQQNKTYYDELRTALLDWFDSNPVQLPGVDNADVVQIGFVTDRHCNIGMDRVTVALLKHFGVTTLVSGGDDAFSGTFNFESACTRNLADKSAQAGITDVFAAGNHDSPYTIAQEAKQGIKTLTGDPVTVGGLTFLGSPDPRSSRYGQGMRPVQASVQHAQLEAQATAIGSRACKDGAPIIVVLHDPAAGKEAMQRGCGNVTIDLGGHTHIQDGPNPVPLPNGRIGYQFIGASAGGAPGGSSTDRSLASQITVGPLRNNATVNIVSIDKHTSALVGITEFTFTPAKTITVSQQITR